MGAIISFLIGICLIAVVIIAVRWLLGLAGIAIPQPLMLIIGILLFVVLLVWLFGGGISLPSPHWR